MRLTYPVVCIRNILRLDLQSPSMSFPCISSSLCQSSCYFHAIYIYNVGLVNFITFKMSMYSTSNVNVLSLKMTKYSVLNCQCTQLPMYETSCHTQCNTILQPNMQHSLVYCNISRYSEQSSISIQTLPAPKNYNQNSLQFSISYPLVSHH